jgi:hypothetical protein
MLQASMLPARVRGAVLRLDVADQHHQAGMFKDREGRLGEQVRIRNL